jgi:DNA-binding SARP family transcriptional activator
MADTCLQLLGGFCLTYTGQPVHDLDSPRLRSLIAYLALHHDRPHLRRHLAFLFWSDSSEAQAHINLRKQLLYLRK